MSQTRDCCSLAPTTIKALKESIVDGILVSDRIIINIKILGVVTQVNRSSNELDFTVDDQTGSILCRQITFDSYQPPPLIGSYVSVYGTPKTYNQEKYVAVFKWQRMTDANEITCHILEVVQLAKLTNNLQIQEKMNSIQKTANFNSISHQTKQINTCINLFGIVTTVPSIIFRKYNPVSISNFEDKAILILDTNNTFSVLMLPKNMDNVIRTEFIKDLQNARYFQIKNLSIQSRTTVLENCSWFEAMKKRGCTQLWFFGLYMREDTLWEVQDEIDVGFAFSNVTITNSQPIIDEPPTTATAATSNDDEPPTTTTAVTLDDDERQPQNKIFKPYHHSSSSDQKMLLPNIDIYFE